MGLTRFGDTSYKICVLAEKDLLVAAVMGEAGFKGLASLSVDKHLKAVSSTWRTEEAKLGCELCGEWNLTQ